MADGGQGVWDLMVAELNTPPLAAVPDEEEPMARPAALPPGAPVGPQQEAAALDAFLGARR